MDRGSPSSVLKIRDNASQTLIMERDFYRDDFESLLKRKADEHRMYPAEKIWENIGNKLHGNLRNFFIKAGGFTIVLICFFGIIPSRYQQRFSPIEGWKVAAIIAEQNIAVTSPKNLNTKKASPALPAFSNSKPADQFIKADALPSAVALEASVTETTMPVQTDVPAEKNYITDFVASFDKTLKGSNAPMPDFAETRLMEPFKTEESNVELILSQVL